ncbi:ubiquinol-cytochrome c reductase cytochrome b subunit [Plantactinospora sp. KLBMP9567]|uniref:cytochrome bc1 complex cytochrome b subunit n=1 Tax=Plantactinospora sp. KLBMP9567 TaxID=3085900 RepID=UPI0029828C18|nr:ubiquinol-cytochrome c reductase cytochrome b subunit [Plantactinospora sp. KLBMP9567]MDW5322961.1 ubiquinol-cytochrome c reductase cytochrome b subunit [Plantactinospora sp. KLBMP9567]
MKRRRFDLATVPGKAAREVDDRLQVNTPLRAVLNKVFPDHWSFLLGEIALFSFIVLLLTGVYLTLFFEPSLREVTYDGSYRPLQGTHMSAAYATSLDISFDVRGGLVMRQMHHWAALLFMASIIVHMMRIFFTGAFRKPRELNWMIGYLLFWVGFLAGFTGYSLPDDGLSGTGLRIASAIMLSIPVVGTWVTTAIFAGEFPGEIIISRFFIAHVLLIPALLVGLITAHLGLVFKQKHTQWPGPGRTNSNVVGERFFPRYVLKQGGFFMVVFGVIALLGGLAQINPIWLFGPYEAGVVSAASQPDWYVMFLDGSTRLMPPWEINLPIGDGYVIPPLFWPTVVLPGILTMVPLFYPFIEARLNKDRETHNLLQRPRDVPGRTALGAMAVSFWLVLTLSGANDVIAEKFWISLNAMTWAGRIGLIVVPPLAYYLTYRICLGLQQHDREVLAHGVETGIIRRLPNGQFVEVHQPLGQTDEHGHGELEYVGWVVPKKMNRLGALGPAIRGFFYPIEKPAEAPVSPGHPPVEPRPERQEIGSGSGSSR